MLTEDDAVRRVEIANGLRALADVVEKYGGENWPLPYGVSINLDLAVGTYETVDGEYKMVYDTDATLKALRKAVRGMGRGKKEKLFNDWLFSVKREFGGNVTLKFDANREAVCRKVPTGNTIIHEESTYTTPRRVEQEFEWVCEDNLLTTGTKDTFAPTTK